jgi:curli biogenesis system outer membrane secretion channel CsgG
MKKLQPLFFVFILLFSIIGYSKIITTTETFTGTGKTESLAVQDALINVIASTNPTLVGSLKSSYSGEMGGTFFDSPKYGQWDTSQIQATTQGAVQSYTIIKKIEKNNLWTVSINAKISTYKSAYSEKNETLSAFAIMPFQVNLGAVNANIKLSQVSALITQTILNDLSTSKNIRIVDRSASDNRDYEKEMQLLRSNSAQEKQRARLSQMLGADYFLTGDISRLTFKKIKKEYYGSSFDKWQINVSINYKVVEVATMGIISTGSATSNISDATVREILSNDGDMHQIEQMLFKDVSHKIAIKVRSDLPK